MLLRRRLSCIAPFFFQLVRFLFEENRRKRKRKVEKGEGGCGSWGLKEASNLVLEGIYSSHVPTVNLSYAILIEVVSP